MEEFSGVNLFDQLSHVRMELIFLHGNKPLPCLVDLSACKQPGCHDNRSYRGCVGREAMPDKLKHDLNMAS